MQYSKQNKEDRTATIMRRRELVMAMQEPVVQTKPEINSPADEFEQHADEVGKKVSNNEDASHIVKNQPSLNSNIQNKSEETGTLMKKSGDGNLSGTDQLQAKLDSSKGGGQSLDDNTKTSMEKNMGVDLSDVKIHTDSKANEMSEGINAKAFTHGGDIYFKEGNYNPNTSDGKSLLGHELAHTQQQKGGVNRKIQRKPDKNTLLKNAKNELLALQLSITNIPLLMDEYDLREGRKPKELAFKKNIDKLINRLNADGDKLSENDIKLVLKRINMTRRKILDLQGRQNLIATEYKIAKGNGDPSANLYADAVLKKWNYFENLIFSDLELNDNPKHIEFKPFSASSLPKLEANIKMYKRISVSSNLENAKKSLEEVAGVSWGINVPANLAFNKTVENISKLKMPAENDPQAEEKMRQIQTEMTIAVAEANCFAFAGQLMHAETLISQAKSPDTFSPYPGAMERAESLIKIKAVIKVAGQSLEMYYNKKSGLKTDQERLSLSIRFYQSFSAFETSDIYLMMRQFIPDMEKAERDWQAQKDALAEFGMAVLTLVLELGIVLAAAYTGGLAGGLAGEMFAATELGGLASFGTEVLAFTATSRGLHSIVGEESQQSFGDEFFQNLVLFKALAASGKSYESVAGKMKLGPEAKAAGGFATELATMTTVDAAFIAWHNQSLPKDQQLELFSFEQLGKSATFLLALKIASRAATPLAKSSMPIDKKSQPANKALIIKYATDYGAPLQLETDALNKLLKECSKRGPETSEEIQALYKHVGKMLDLQKAAGKYAIDNKLFSAEKKGGKSDIEKANENLAGIIKAKSELNELQAIEEYHVENVENSSDTFYFDVTGTDAKADAEKFGMVMTHNGKDGTFKPVKAGSDVFKFESKDKSSSKTFIPRYNSKKAGAVKEKVKTPKNVGLEEMGAYKEIRPGAKEYIFVYKNGEHYRIKDGEYQKWDGKAWVKISEVQFKKEVPENVDYLPEKKENPQDVEKHMKKLNALQPIFDKLVEQHLIAKYRKLDPDLKYGYTGSFKTGRVGNERKLNYGKLGDLTKFDIDFWIESDILFKQKGKKLYADEAFKEVLDKTPGFEGLKPDEAGFSIKFKPKID